MKDLLTHILNEHGGKIASACVVLYVALVTSMPRNREDFSLYGYIYDVTHALIPIRIRGEKPNA